MIAQLGEISYRYCKIRLTKNYDLGAVFAHQVQVWTIVLTRSDLLIFSTSKSFFINYKQCAQKMFEISLALSDEF